MQRLLAERHPFQGGTQGAERLRALLLDAGNLLPGLLQGFAHRRQHGGDGLLAVSEVPDGAFALLPQHLAGHLQEQFAVATQGLAGRRVEAGA